VLVDEVDGPSGGHIVGRLWVEPKLPATDSSGLRTVEDDPAIASIRRAPEAGVFLQCHIPLPIPTGAETSAVDPTVLARLTEYMQGVMTQICRVASGR
jgi:hypothetical protein